MTHIRRYEPLLKTITRHHTAKDEEVKIWDVLREKAFVLNKNNDTRHRHRDDQLNIIEIRVNNSNCGTTTYVPGYEPLLKTMTRHHTTDHSQTTSGSCPY